MKRVLYLCGLLLTPLCLAGEAPVEAPQVEPAPVVVFNREITVFRTAFGNLTPAHRRDTTLKRMASVTDLQLYEPVRAVPASIGDTKGISFMIGHDHLFTLLEDDLDPASGQSLQEAGEVVRERLEEVREAKRTQRSPSVIIRGVVVTIASSLIFFALIWLLRWLGKKLRRFVLQKTSRLKQLKVSNLDLRPVMLQAFRRVLVMIGWLIALGAAYIWIGTVLAQFPYTAPWGTRLGDQVRELFADFLHGFFAALPGIAIVVVIFAITRWFARLTDHLFRQFEERHESDSDSWLGHDTARASRRIVVVLIWIIGITISYPYIPGSESPAFKGISVLLGLMISLGSTGLVNQVMSGFVVLYSGAVRTGEYARLGDVEGTIQEINLLSTKVLTPRREYVTVPNAVLISKETINYSRIAENDQRTELSTAVTIGYDSPWRQVHAMLLLAAERTPGIRREPASKVLQTALSDFYVHYELRFVPADISRRGAILSDLHQNIQDVFNEFGVQIMSPNFEAQPENPVLSPKDQWHLAPAAPAKETKAKD